MAKNNQEVQGESFLDLDLENVPTLITLPEGEYKVRIASCEVKTSQSNKQYINVRFDVPSEPMSEDIYHLLMLPSNEATEKQNIRRRADIRDFCLAFGVEPSRPAMNDFIGQEGWVLLAEEDDPQYGKRNVVKKVVGGN